MRASPFFFVMRGLALSSVKPYSSLMDVWKAIKNRRTVHHYQPDIPLERAQLDEALQLALLAPNHKFTFPWRFTVVGPETRAQLADLAEQLLLESDPEAPGEKRQKTREKILFPSAFLIVAMPRVDDQMISRENYASIACGIQNLTLSLVGHGFQAKWSTGKITRNAQSYALLDIDIKDFEILGFLSIGQAAIEPSRQRRPDWKDCVRDLP